MNQVWIYDYALKKKDVVLTDASVKTFDCGIPQLTTFEIPKETNIVDSDLIIIKGDNMYIGVIERIGGVNTKEVATYPIEHLFDNDLDIDKLDGEMKVVEYLTAQIKRNFVDTDDVYMRLPFVFESTLEEDVEYKTIVETSNLLDIINEIYYNTGIYLDFDLVYESGVLSAIKIIFKDVSKEKIQKIRYDNPQIVDKVNYQFSNTTTNKATIWVGKTEESKGTPYKVYLREDNELTTNPADPYRIKKVINKNIDLTAEIEAETEDERAEKIAEAVIVTARKELKSDIFGYEIQFTILANKNNKWHYRQACVFTSEDRTFYSLVTRVEYLSEKHLRITLGAYRTKLHEKILKLAKPKQVAGKSLGGIQVTNGLGQYLYWFEQDSDGNLFVCSDGLSEEELQALFELDADKNLYVNYKDNQREALSLENGKLIGGY